MDFVNKKSFKLAEGIIGLVIAVITAYVANKLGSNNYLSDALVGFLLPYIIFMPFQINGNSNQKTHTLEKALQKLESKSPRTYNLYNIEVNELIKSIDESCESMLYKCSYKPNMSLYKAVCAQLMSMFSGETEQDYFYATAWCSKGSINWFFDQYNLAGEFLPLLNEKCQAKKITDFRRLFIYNDKDELKNPVLYLLARLHNNTKDLKSDYCPFDFKFVDASTFVNLTKKNHISDEMGVWGSHCVFIQKNDRSPKGYCFEKNSISTHKSIFELLWSNTSSVHFEELGITVKDLKANDEFEKEVLQILNNIENNKVTHIISTAKSDDKLSLLDIIQIQSWVQGKYPISTSEDL